MGLRIFAIGLLKMQVFWSALQWRSQSVTKTWMMPFFLNAALFDTIKIFCVNFQTELNARALGVSCDVKFDWRFSGGIYVVAESELGIY